MGWSLLGKGLLGPTDQLVAVFWGKTTSTTSEELDEVAWSQPGDVIHAGIFGEDLQRSRMPNVGIFDVEARVGVDVSGDRGRFAE